VCPTAAIHVRRDTGGGGAWHIDYGQCVFCSACVLACPEGAIVASDAFELAVRERAAAVSKHSIEVGHV
jgi:formate hydrogenlyase subunit 6/NADH:ubiquinone oxidoreductase subunit I